MTLVQIAGTSGSGKSHLMRSFLHLAREKGKVVETDDGYTVSFRRLLICVVGKYDTPTGGCDTIRDVREIYSRLAELSREFELVLFEGLFVMNQTRGPQLAAQLGREFCVLQLTTPLAECFSSINSRRAARGEGELENQKNTKDNYRRALNYCASMRDAGARVIKVSRDEALPKLLELLDC